MAVFVLAKTSEVIMVGGGRTIIIIIILEGDAVYGWVESGCHRHLSLVEGWFSVVGGRWSSVVRWWSVGVLLL